MPNTEQIIKSITYQFFVIALWDQGLNREYTVTDGVLGLDLHLLLLFATILLLKWEDLACDNLDNKVLLCLKLLSWDLLESPNSFLGEASGLFEVLDSWGLYSFISVHI